MGGWGQYGGAILIGDRAISVIVDVVRWWNGIDFGGEQKGKDGHSCNVTTNVRSLKHSLSLKPKDDYYCAAPELCAEMRKYG